MKLLFVLLLAISCSAYRLKRDATTLDKGFRDNCFPRGSGHGCTCSVNTNGRDETLVFDTDDKCKKPVEIQTAENKQKVNVEIKEKFKDFRDNCFPRGSGHGCTCSVTDASGREDSVTFDTDEKCKKPVEVQTAENKKQLNDEFKEKYGGLKENCFPRPGKGCRCVTKSAEGQEQEQLYEADADCKVPKLRERRQASQNVRDPVRERAQQNYAAVVDELKTKFRGLREGCYPRPKGCLCVIGKNGEGRDITERRMKDEDCKCKPHERSRECPAQGA